jgi:omega-amidase
MPDLTQLRVSLVQADLAWHDRDANLRRFERMLRPLAGQTDLIVLPEMFTTGFTMAAKEVAEPAHGPTVEWMRRLAAELGAALTGSVVTGEAGEYFNRLIWMPADGQPAFYDKRHLFRMAREHEHYSAGERRIVVELGGWKVCPLVCYDLRFPVWSRNRIGTPDAYDLLIYVANWPERRRHAWQSLLRARAIENLSCCVGVNRVGHDGNDIAYVGDSAALDHLGLSLLPEATDECVRTVTFDRVALQGFRQRFPAHLDADDFTIAE